MSSAVVAGNTETYAAVMMKRASELAWEMQERISAEPYYDPTDNSLTLGPEAGESSMLLFDNKDDYNGYAEAKGHLTDAMGTLLPSEYQLFSRSVTAAYETKTITGLGSVPGLTVTVTVTDPHGVVMSLAQFYPQSLN